MANVNHSWGGASPEVAELETAISKMAYLLNRTRRHDWMKAESRVPLDRAAMAVLRQLAETGPIRVGGLAELMHVEAPHVTRQTQLLERAGYAKRVDDPEDGRAQLIELTASGRAAAKRVREAARSGLEAALANWSAPDLRALSLLVSRLAEDLVADARAGDLEQRPAVAR